MDLKDVWVVEAVSHVVIGVILTIHGNIGVQTLWNRIVRNHCSNRVLAIGGVLMSISIDCITLGICESNLDVGAVLVTSFFAWAVEVFTMDGNSVVSWVLGNTVGWAQTLDSWTLVDIEGGFVIGLPVLEVDGDLEPGLASSVSLWGWAGLLISIKSVHWLLMVEWLSVGINPSAVDGLVSASTVVVLELIPVESVDSHKRVSIVIKLLWSNLLDEEVLDVSEGVLHISEVESEIVDPLLVVASHRDDDSSSNVSGWRSYVDMSIVHSCWDNMCLLISQFEATNVLLSEANTNNCRVGSSLHWSKVWSHRVDLWVIIILELGGYILSWAEETVSVKRHTNIVPHLFVLCLQLWTVAKHGL